MPTDWRRARSRRPSGPAAPVSRPSASQPARYSMRIGWRLACMSRRLLAATACTSPAGRRSQAASAVCAWLVMSSLPPKAPPLDTSSTVTSVVLDAEHDGDLVAVVPHALAAGVHVQRPAVGVGHGEGRLGLEEGVLDALGLEHLVHDVGAGGERGVDVAPGVRRRATARCRRVPHTAIVGGRRRPRPGR